MKRPPDAPSMTHTAVGQGFPKVQAHRALLQASAVVRADVCARLRDLLPPDLVPRDRNFNRGGSTIRRVYDAIADRASTDRWAAACPPPRSRASWAVRTAVPVGGRYRRGPIGRAGGTAAHAKGPRGAAGRRGRAQGAVGASADGRAARAVLRLAGARVDGGLRGPACASRAARVRRWVRIWSITDVCVMNATTRIAP